MGAPKLVAVLACWFVAGCGGIVQPGLANAPWLGGATPETRVHDVIANGRDACERSAFPQGGVLRGQIPPCKSDVRFTLTPHFTPPPPPEAWSPQSYPLEVCPGPARVRRYAYNNEMSAISAPRLSPLMCGPL
jgi:hypothetical protein